MHLCLCIAFRLHNTLFLTCGRCHSSSEAWIATAHIGAPATASLANPCEHLNDPDVLNLQQLFAAVLNVIHKESHFTTHVYLTLYRAAHYGAILDRLAMNITVRAAKKRQCSGCIIQMATCLLITQKHIFTE